MRLNKKKTKVHLDKKYQALGLSALGVQYGLPIAYVAHTYGLFTMQNETYAFTGGALIAGFIAYFAFKNKAKEFINDYNTHLSATAQRMKSGFVWLTIGLIVWVASIYISAFLWLCVVLGGSTILSYPLWAIYDKQSNERVELQKILDEKKTESRLKTLQSL